MKFGFIGTWRMSFEAIKENIEILKNEDSSGEAIVKAIAAIEDNQYFKSVGFGGLPNENCIPEFDAAFMNGQTLGIGAVAGVKNLANPIKVAQSLSLERFNSFLVAQGAENYAMQNGFEFKNMLSDRAIAHYQKKQKTLKDNPNLSPYDGHDTVGMVSLDAKSNIFAATSTSGLFMKKPGRVGDSPLPGSGFYCEQGVGGASATGLGEDIFKGILSFQVVEQLRMGADIKVVVQKIVHDFHQKMVKRYGKCGAISVIALNDSGEWGVGTNCEFSFVVGNHKSETKIYLATPSKDLSKVIFKEPSPEWLTDYDKARRGPIN